MMVQGNDHAHLAVRPCGRHLCGLCIAQRQRPDERQAARQRRVLVALAACYAWLRPPVLAPLQEGRRLMDSVGWAAVLPQMLAALGAVFALAGVGEVVGGISTRILPEGSLVAAVALYGIGMAVF